MPIHCRPSGPSGERAWRAAYAALWPVGGGTRTPCGCRLWQSDDRREICTAKVTFGAAFRRRHHGGAGRRRLCQLGRAGQCGLATNEVIHGRIMAHMRCVTRRVVFNELHAQ